jgi:hypothetical protein
MNKIILLLTLATLTACGAETNTMRVFSTNYVAAASNLREVDGQLYDVLRSQKWESIRCKYQNQAGELAVFRKIDRVKIGERPAPKPTETDNLNSSGLFQSAAATLPSMPVDRGIYADQDGEYILLKNFLAAHIVTGQELTPRLLRVGETNFNGNIVAIYDCGQPHLVPVVISKTVKKNMQ